MLPVQLGKHFWPDFAFVSGSRIDYLSPTLYLLDLVIVTFLLSSIPLLSLKTVGGFFTRYRIPLFLLCVVCLMSFIVAVAPLATLYGIARLLELGCFAIAAIQVLSAERQTALRNVALCLASGMLVTSALAFGQIHTHGSLGGLWYFLGERTFTAETPGIANASINGSLVLRPYATFPHPNVLAWYLFFGIVIASEALASSQSLKRITPSNVLLVSAILLGAPALFFTLSRSVLLFFLLFLLFLPLLLMKNLRNRSAIFGVLSLLVVCGLAFLLFPRFATLLAADTALSQRQALITAAFGMIAHYPVTGVGLSTFLIRLPDFFPLTQPLLLQPVHNIFLLVFSETGIIGFGLFLWLLVRAFQKSLTVANPTLRFVLLFLLISAWGIGMVDHYFLTLEQGQLLFVLLLSLCFAYGKTA